MRKSEHSSSTPLTATFDRGPARYFHGRTQILRDFEELVERSMQANGGTIFLIQGPPGAGKSALLYECEKMVEPIGWNITDIDPPAFWDVNELRQSLDLRRTINVEAGSVRVGLPDIVEAEVSTGRSPQTVKGLLQKDKDPLLLILDEAQALGKIDDLSPDQRHTATGILKAIHNGTLDRPVILLAAGLGMTSESFESFQISRFSESCFVELGSLRKKSERAVILDWLKREGGVKEDPRKWIDAIVQETHGWPQHIVSYADSAAKQLDVDNGVMTANGLRTVMEKGRGGRYVIPIPSMHNWLADNYTSDSDRASSI